MSYCSTARTLLAMVLCLGLATSGCTCEQVDDKHPTKPAPVVDLGLAIDVAVNSATSCAVLQDGSVWCWGEGQMGLLGPGRTDRELRPVQIDGVSGALDVELSMSWACARCRDQALVCWGGRNPLGGSKTGQIIRFSEVDGFSLYHRELCTWATSADDQTQVSCAKLHSALAATQTTTELRAWQTVAGKVDQATGPDSHAPPPCILGNAGQVWCSVEYGREWVPVAGLKGAAKIAYFDGWLVVLRQNKILGARTRAGKGSYGLDQIHNWGSQALKPLPLPEDALISDFEHSHNRLCAWAQNGRAWCWMIVGSSVGREGQTLAKEPQQLQPAGDLVQLAVNTHTCLRRSSGQISCWGNNGEGQVGNGRRTKTKRKLNLKF